METEELDFAIDELEIRLERLRALYEQYFLGIEKLEPQVARKDVDRRIFVLRREKIRNTGRRFKLQTLIQRYNTFQQYWQRICREIENGTYKRHLIRAEKTVGPTALLTVAARRRFGKQKERDAASDDAAAAAATSASQFPEPPQDEVTNRIIRPADLAPSPESDAPEVPRQRSRVPTLPGLSSAPPPPSVAPPFERMPPAAAAPVVGRPVPVTPLPDARPAARSLSSRAPRPAQSFESLELDMDFMGDWDPGTAARGRPGSTAANARPPGRSRSERPAPMATSAAERRLAPPPKPQRAPAKPSIAEPEAAPRAAVPSPATPPPPAASSLAAAKPAVASAPPPALVKPAASVATGAPPTIAKPAIAKPAAEAGAASGGSAVAAKSAPTGAARPAKPAAAQKPAQAEKSAARAAGELSVSEGKLKELHQRFSEASKGAGQTAPSLEGLSKSLRAAEAKLRQQHGNRRIDFEVVLKDGKPVVKPVVR